MSSLDKFVAMIVDPAFLASAFAAIASFATVLTLAAPRSRTTS